MQRLLVFIAVLALQGCYELPGPPGELVRSC